MTDPLTALRERFRARAAADRAQLQILAEGDLNSSELRRLVHNLAGTAGTFGYASLSEAAGLIDDDMAAGLSANPVNIDRLKTMLDEVAWPSA